MIVQAHQKYLRQTPTRLRLVADEVKTIGNPVVAMQRLSLMNKRAARTLHKVMTQAIANAVNNHGLAIESLTIREILVNEGPQFKRMRAASRGRGNVILRRTSHVKITLESTTQVEVEKETKTTSEELKTTAEINKAPQTIKAKPVKRVTKPKAHKE